MSKHIWKTLSYALILAMMLAILPVVGVSADGKIEAGDNIESVPPTVDGLFYGSGEDTVYYYLTENPGRGQLFYYLQGSILYVAMVVDPDVNDNVFGDMSVANDIQYVREVNWKGQANQHTAKALINSEHFEFRLSCGGSSWQWIQDLAYLSGTTWRSDSLGPDGGGTPPPGFISSASSLQRNFNSPVWNAPAHGTPTNSDTWQSPYVTENTLAGTNYPYYSTTYDWEWSIVYEFATDLSATCGTTPFTIEVVSAHNSPPKVGDPDIPVDPVDMLDYGDAPYDPASPYNDDYPTLLAQNGARHYIIVGGPYLGNFVDADADGQPDGNAAGDDGGAWPIYQDLSDDEDGITNWYFPTRNQVCFDVNMGPVAAYVDGWIDWDRNGIFDTDEYLALGGRSFAAGETRTVCLTPNDDRIEGITYARFRVSTSTTPLAPLGLAADGEVEDYLLNLSPLLIELASFGAKPAGDAILVEWETATELDNLGFNLYRSEAVDGPRVQLNAGLIPSAVAPGSLFGASYSLLDTNVVRGTTYFYWLEDVDIHGVTTLHGPASATLTTFRLSSPIRRIGP